MKRLLLIGMLAALPGCGFYTLEPGHRGLRFDPHGGGLKHEVLQPGSQGLGWCFLRDCGRIDDFDVTYSTRRETVHTASQEGLGMDVALAVIYRPVISELYELDTEVGPSFYEEVVGPEFRSASRGVFAHHPYTELLSKNDKIEDEIEAEVRRRTRGKHVEIASVTIEKIDYAPEIVRAVREKLVAEQEAVRQKSALENEAVRRKTQLESEAAAARQNEENEAAQARLQAEHESDKAKRESEQEADKSKREAELELLRARNQRAVAGEQAAAAKIDAQRRLIEAHTQAEEIVTLARAHAEENRAKALELSPLQVEMAAYEALGKLGGTNTNIWLGDWAHAPQFLFPHAGAAAWLSPMTLTPPNVRAPAP